MRQVQDLLEQAPFTITAAFYPTLLAHDERAALPVLRAVPVTVLCGGGDRLTPVGHSRRMAAEIGQGAELVVVPGCRPQREHHPTRGRRRGAAAAARARPGPRRGVSPVGTVSSLTTWPVKSLGGGVAHGAVPADGSGLAGDRRYAVATADGRPLSARREPGLLRWAAAPAADGPLLTGPDGRSWSWDDPDLPAALSADLDRPVRVVAVPAGAQDLADSVLVTTAATHRAVEQAFGARLEPSRWRTNVHLDGDLPPFVEHSWEGGTLQVGEVVLRLLHPCKRCTIPTYAPGGLARTPELLRHLSAGEHAGPFGINARVEVPGVLVRGADVGLGQGELGQGR